MSCKYPVNQPNLNGNENKYVQECLNSTWISSKGKFINQFEDQFSKFTGIKNSIAVSNGTVALHVALVTLGIGNDEVRKILIEANAGMIFGYEDTGEEFFNFCESFKTNLSVVKNFERAKIAEAFADTISF